MFTFNSKTFVKKSKGAVLGASDYGFYRRIPNGVQLYNRDGALQAFIVDNVRRERFIVTAHMTEKGARYMFSTCSLTEKWLGVEGLSCSAQLALIDAAIPKKVEAESQPA